MKRIVEIGVRPANPGLEFVDPTDFEVIAGESTAAFVGHTTVTGRMRGQDISDSYRLSRAYLKQEAEWRMVTSQKCSRGEA